MERQNRSLPAPEWKRPENTKDKEVDEAKRSEEGTSTAIIINNKENILNSTFLGDEFLAYYSANEEPLNLEWISNFLEMDESLF